MASCQTSICYALGYVSISTGLVQSSPAVITASHCKATAQSGPAVQGTSSCKAAQSGPAVTGNQQLQGYCAVRTSSEGNQQLEGYCAVRTSSEREPAAGRLLRSQDQQ
eukprot:jgi/Chrzof1/2466/Cz11g16230.t1